MTAIPMIHEETTDTTNNSQIDQNFSVRTFKILGRMQIVLGAIMCTLSLVNATVDGINMKKSEESVTVEGFIIDSICIVIPGWKIAFMVCCIIGAVVFVPTAFVFSLNGSIWRSSSDMKITAIVSILSTLLAFVEFVVAVVAASFCCCCSKWSTSNIQQGVWVMVPVPQMQQTSMSPVVMTSRQQQYATEQPQQLQSLNPCYTEDENTNP